MTGDREKPEDITKYKIGHIVVALNNSRLLIAHVNTTVNVVLIKCHFKMCIMSQV